MKNTFQKLQEKVLFFSSQPQSLLWLGLLIYAVGDFLTHTVFIKYTPIDLSEQILWSQNLKLGYGIQPPIYTFLQIAILKLLPFSIFSFQILHELLFSGTLVLIYLTFEAICKKLNLSLFIATLASFCFVFVSGELIEVPVKTHTALATLMAATTIYIITKILECNSEKTPSKLFILLGLALGIGFLSKYNFVFLAVTIFITALFNKQSREKIFQNKLLISVLICAAIVTPNFLWLYQNRHLAVSDFTPKVLMYKAPEISLASELLLTAKELFSGVVLTYFLPFTLFFLGVYLLSQLSKQRASSNKSILSKDFFSNPQTSFLIRLFAIEIILILLLAFGFKINRVRIFWFQPLFFFLPGMTFLFLYSQNIWNQLAQKLLMFVIFALLVISPFFKIYYLKTFVESKLLTRKDIQVTYLPAIKNTGFRSGLIVADVQNRNIAADLKLFFPESKVIWWPDRFNRELATNKTNEQVLLISEGDLEPVNKLKNTFKQNKKVKFEAPLWLRKKYKGFKETNFYY